MGFLIHRYMGKHLASMDIYPVDTRDHIGRGRFIGHSLRRLLFPGGVSLFDKYWKESLYLVSCLLKLVKL